MGIQSLLGIYIYLLNSPISLLEILSYFIPELVSLRFQIIFLGGPILFLLALISISLAYGKNERIILSYISLLILLPALLPMLGLFGLMMWDKKI